MAIPQRPADGPEEPIPFWQFAPAIEFLCWVVVSLAPILYLVNGPPVTSDQAVFQISLVTLAVVGAVALRVVNLRNSKRWEELFAKLAEKGKP
ncbi:hypothetical protein [Botrimarina hoheduenensis]|uniref:Uncharacterized protein n=1 Tax=Botrimarina hoheduenensis TaxID=2528000 RepID=A0A5C5VTC2_9BACT|nr:hypothetical protein [Botrimarina hoheduenensis]TWT41353.1 hypothetical protein Pla111_30670 [Botrimarina hoheduenensis]